MENKNEMTPQELLAKLKESIKSESSADDVDKNTSSENNEISDEELISRYDEEEPASSPTVKYHYTVRRREPTVQPEGVQEGGTEDNSSEEEVEAEIPSSDIVIDAPRAEAAAPVDMMKEFMSDEEIAQMQRLAAMPDAQEIAEQAKELAERDAQEEDVSLDEPLSLTDQVEIAYGDSEEYYTKLANESGQEAQNEQEASAESDKIKMNISPSEASKRNAMDFITSLTKKAARTTTEAATAAGEAAAVAAKAAEDTVQAAQEVASDAAGAASEAAPNVDEYDDVDVNLMIAFGMEDRLKEAVGDKEAQKITDQADTEAKNYTNTDVFKAVDEEEKPVTEFTDNSQIKTIFAAYKTRYRKYILKLGACALISVFLFFFENLSAFGGKLPEALNPGYYPIVNIMIGLQMLLFLTALVWDAVKRGINSLLAKKPIPESAMAVILFLSFLYQLLTLFFSRADINTYIFPVSIAALLTLTGGFLSLKREIYSFNIVASKKVKYTLEAVGESECKDEREAFSYFFGDDLKKENTAAEVSGETVQDASYEEGVSENAEAVSPEEDAAPESRPVYKMKRGAFIDGFFERMNTYPSYKAVLNFIIPVFAIISLAFFILGFIRTGNVSGAIRMGYIALAICAPASMFISFNYPAYKASKNAFVNESAIIGEATPEEYLDTAIMTFEDKDIFPPRGVKVKSIKVYGSHRIDRVVFNAANIFRKYGGPLSSVFNKATLELGTTDEVFFGTVEDDGIEAMVSGSHIYLGTTDYLHRKGYETVIDDEDEVVEGNGGICIMFMAIEDEVAAKFYVEYTLDAEFEHILRALYTSGICIAVRSYDPNISDRMLNLLLRYEQFPVKVIKTRSDENINIAKEHAKSGVVSRRSVKDMLRAFMSCDKVLRAVKSATVMKMASMAVGIIVLLIMLVFGAGTGVASLYTVLFQLFWMIPLLIIVRFLL